MNWKQWLVLVCGFIFMGINLLFPRYYHGNHFHFYATAEYFNIGEMITRQILLLALLIGLLLMLQSEKWALNLGQKVCLLIGMTLLTLVFLYPPNFYGEFNNNYFAPNWDVVAADYSFTFIWFLLALYIGSLTSLLGHRSVLDHLGGIGFAVILPVIASFFPLSSRIEDALVIDPLMMLLGAIVGLIVLGVIQKKMKLNE